MTAAAWRPHERTQLFAFTGQIPVEVVDGTTSMSIIYGTVGSNLAIGEVMFRSSVTGMVTVGTGRFDTTVQGFAITTISAAGTIKWDCNDWVTTCENTGDKQFKYAALVSTTNSVILAVSTIQTEAGNLTVTEDGTLTVTIHADGVMNFSVTQI